MFIHHHAVVLSFLASLVLQISKFLYTLFTVPLGIFYHHFFSVSDIILNQNFCLKFEDTFPLTVTQIQS